MLKRRIDYPARKTGFDNGIQKQILRFDLL